MGQTMAVGSPEHREYQRSQVKRGVASAKQVVSDDAVFSPDQSALLRDMLDALGDKIERAF